MQLQANLVQEWEAGDEFVQSIKSWGDQVLAVVTQKLQDCEHGQAAVLKFIQLEFVHITTHGVLARIKVTEEAIVIDGTNGEKDLGPSQCRNGIKGGNTVGD